MSYNPLNWSGPEFLLFYIAFTAVTLLYIKSQWKKKELVWNVPNLNLTDPYEIAYLRQGKVEAVKIALLSLIDRGLLDIDERKLTTKNNSSRDQVRRPIEKAILEKYANSGFITDAFKDEAVSNACYEYERTLERKRLLASDDTLRDRKSHLGLGIFLFIGLAGLKIIVAISRGHYNVQFLFILAIGAIFILAKLYQSKQTALGKRALKDLENLFQNLKYRAYSIPEGGATNEAPLAAAVFGAYVLSPLNFPYAHSLQPVQASSGYSSWDSSCGSSCSSGSSCGSSCGGGCGGGCGGCGGS